MVCAGADFVLYYCIFQEVLPDALETQILVSCLNAVERLLPT